MRQIPKSNRFFVYLREHQVKNSIIQTIESYFPNSNFVCIEKILNGPVRSLEIAISEIKSNNTKIVIDCDQAIGNSDLFNIVKNVEENPNISFVSSIKSNNPQHGYLVRNYDGKIIDLKEKEIVGKDALGGIYVFGKAIDIKSHIDELVNSKKSELFMSDLLNLMIKKNLEIYAFQTEKQLSFGTPAEYELAQSFDIESYLEWN
jgi:dTDP-glucose pyrophosphorylase